ncbi:MAG TPA: gas vesicle protein GvpJ [Thermoleophilaceae bacterium]
MSSAVAPRQPQSMTQVQRQPRPSGLADVLDVVLDKGLVVDVYVRVALVGIELLTIDARIVIASVDTYLRFAEAVNRLDLTQVEEGESLPELFGDMEEGGAGRKTKGVLEGAKEALFGGEDDEDSGDGSSKRKSSSSKRSTSASKRTSAKKSSSSSNGRSRSRSRSSKSGSRGR